ncbi:energy transducer TonB [Luteithermobacter gelatinilyticus]|uniref:energy transducer TonB n=1 Tax=Luteithermobacter gelatinilyticus TaxID=2582913 RepID=UPI00143CF69C|nr:TonB family protein [Luteithermobacter gelatinilyticus]
MTGISDARASDIKSWQGKIVKLVSKKQVYPRAAMRQELEGKAKVKISFDRSGNIISHEVLQSTGHDILDAEVTNLVKRINPLPAPPAELGDDKLVIVLPLTWTIQ